MPKRRAWVLSGSPSIVQSQSSQRSSHAAALAATIASNRLGHGRFEPVEAALLDGCSRPSTSRDVPMRTILSSRSGTARERGPPDDPLVLQREAAASSARPTATVVAA